MAMCPPNYLNFSREKNRSFFCRLCKAVKLSSGSSSTAYTFNGYALATSCRGSNSSFNNMLDLFSTIRMITNDTMVNSTTIPNVFFYSLFLNFGCLSILNFSLKYS